MEQNIESFAKDKDMAELLELLGQMKNREGYEKLMDAIAYVDTLENTLSFMMKQIVEMREEIKSVHEQNAYLMTKAERGVKDVLTDQLQRAEAKVQELHARLSEVRDSLKKFASDTVKKLKQFGSRAILKIADITHVKQALEDIRNKADQMVGRLDSLSDMVEGYQSRVKYGAERRGAPYQTESYPYEPEISGAVSEGYSYQEASPVLSYEEEMQKFMADRVSEGMTYSCNQDAYEDFKAYYDKKIKAAGQAGKEQPVVRKEMENVRR